MKHIYQPPHYTSGGIETIDYIHAKLGDELFMGYVLGNAQKYLSRCGKKEGNTMVDDLMKCRYYIDKAIKVAKADKDDKAS